MKERDIEKELVRRVKAAGGEIRKVKWIARTNAPDRLVMVPIRLVRAQPLSTNQVPVELSAYHFWVELKRPGEVPTAAQRREHQRMRDAGMDVYVCSTFSELEALPI